MRQVMLADHNLDIRPEIVFVADNFHDSPARALRGRGPVGNLDVHYDVFQVVPMGAPRHFLAQHTVAVLGHRRGRGMWTRASPLVRERH